MSNTNKNTEKEDNEALKAELEKRYGEAVAQEIMDQIERATVETTVPDYMPFKASTEMLELFRGEAQDLSKELRKMRRSRKESKIAYIAERTLEIEFNRIFRLYWTSMKLHHALYHKVKTALSKPSYLSSRLSPQTSGTPLCQAFAA
ncbi:hypothetical protein [Pararhizobium sp. IMCC21322]|uniref:hypothetical protein n=1 Tax=Pararhizobium sp. IMCC21322 TaxID=3067903 RepID=UPI00274118F9|nr:hypothetical protein [Pararhizobium sp. IMCC21322]